MIIKNFSRWALVSGIVFGVSALTPVAVLAGEDTQGSITIDGTANEITEITFTNGADIAFNFDYGASVTDKAIGSVDYVTNVIGGWNIKAVSASGGVLTGETATGVTMDYELKLGGGSYIQPTVEGAVLTNGTITDAPVDETGAPLLLQIPTAQTTEVVAQVYSDTISLVFTSGIQ